MRWHVKNLQESYLQEKSRVCAYSDDVGTSLHVNKFDVMACKDPATAANMRLKILLLSELAEKDAELQKVKQEKTELEKEIQKLKENLSPLSEKELKKQMIIYQNHIQQQDALIQEMSEVIESQKMDCQYSQRNNKKVQEKYQEKLQEYAQVRYQNMALANQNNKNKLISSYPLPIREPPKVFQNFDDDDDVDDPNSTYLTEPTLVKSPRNKRLLPPPHHQKVPVMNLRKIQKKPAFIFSPRRNDGQNFQARLSYQYSPRKM